MSAVWSLPGYEVEVLLGSGSTGEVWQARELATGDRVALERLYEPVDLHTRAALERSARRLESIDSPYLVRLRAVVEDVLVLDHAPGGSLAALVARRGRLTPGEVVTVVAPLAAALASAHGQGVVHGDVSASRVLFSADGMPMLAGLGLPRRRVRRELTDVEPPSVAGDVRALASLCRHLLGPAEVSAVGGAGQAPGAAALAASVDGVLTAAPGHLPDAATFGSMLRRACPAEPLALAGAPASERADPRPAPTRSWVGAPAGPRAPEPVGDSGPPLGRPARAGHRRVRHRSRSRSDVRRARTELPVGAAVAAGIVVLVLAGAAFGWFSGRGEVPVAAAVAPPVGPLAASASAAPVLTPPVPVPPAPAPPAPLLPAPTIPAADWPAVLDGLDAARARAFAAADLTALADVWTPGSPGLAADTAALEQLAAAGQTAHGARHDVRDVRAVTVPLVTDREAADPSDPAEPADPAAQQASARLEVLDVLGAQEIRDNAGRIVRTVAARDAETWLIELVRTPAGWRLRSVSPAQ